MAGTYAIAYHVIFWVLPVKIFENGFGLRKLAHFSQFQGLVAAVVDLGQDFDGKVLLADLLLALIGKTWPVIGAAFADIGSYFCTARRADRLG